MTYGKRMAIEGFFNVPDLPEEKIGGYYFQGHDASDQYVEFVVLRDDLGAAWDRIQREEWYDAIRLPLEIGNILLRDI